MASPVLKRFSKFTWTMTHQLSSLSLSPFPLTPHHLFLLSPFSPSLFSPLPLSLPRLSLPSLLSLLFFLAIQVTQVGRDSANVAWYPSPTIQSEHLSYCVLATPRKLLTTNYVQSSGCSSKPRPEVPRFSETPPLSQPEHNNWNSHLNINPVVPRDNRIHNVHFDVNPPPFPFPTKSMLDTFPPTQSLNPVVPVTQTSSSVPTIHLTSTHCTGKNCHHLTNLTSATQYHIEVLAVNQKTGRALSLYQRTSVDRHQWSLDCKAVACNSYLLHCYNWSFYVAWTLIAKTLLNCHDDKCWLLIAWHPTLEQCLTVFLFFFWRSDKIDLHGSHVPCIIRFLLLLWSFRKLFLYSTRGCCVPLGQEKVCGVLLTKLD